MVQLWRDSPNTVRLRCLAACSRAALLEVGLGAVAAVSRAYY